MASDFINDFREYSNKLDAILLALKAPELRGTGFLLGFEFMGYVFDYNQAYMHFVSNKGSMYIPLASSQEVHKIVEHTKIALREMSREDRTVDFCDCDTLH
jgi:hypothetical protein